MFGGGLKEDDINAPTPLRKPKIRSLRERLATGLGR
jgi:hypothetical protein